MRTKGDPDLSFKFKSMIEAMKSNIFQEVCRRHSISIFFGRRANLV